MEPYKPADKLVAILGLSLAAGAVLCLAGCEDSAKKVATYHPPVIQAATVQQPNVPAKAKPNLPANGQSNPPTKAVAKIGALPLVPSRGRTAFLALMRPDAVDRLAEQVRALFTAGGQEAKASHNEAAKQDYDRALDLLLASGFNFGKEPQLSKLFNEIMSSVSALQNAAPEAEANETQAPAAAQQSQPSPLDQ